MPSPATRLEIDLEALRRNVKTVGMRLPRERDLSLDASDRAHRAQLFAVVKSDAYGLGAARLVPELLACGVDGLCVVSAEEALALRARGICAPIILLAPNSPRVPRARLLAAGIIPTVVSIDDLLGFARIAGPRCPVYLKIDTGMSRVGIPWHCMGEFMRQVRTRHPGLRVQGVFTHFSDADNTGPRTALQATRLREALSAFSPEELHDMQLHAANSAALLNHPSQIYNGVRVGGLLYGIAPTGHSGLVSAVVRWVSEVVDCRRIREGERVGYGGDYIAAHETVIATVGVGYGDGLPYNLSVDGSLLLRGQRCRVVGRVSMNLLTVDATALGDLPPGEEAVIVGRQCSEEITLAELAEWAGSIPYEILTRISPRVPRLYRNAMQEEA